MGFIHFEYQWILTTTIRLNLNACLFETSLLSWNPRCPYDVGSSTLVPYPPKVDLSCCICDDTCILPQKTQNRGGHSELAAVTQ